eukprot:gene12924-39977_t
MDVTDSAHGTVAALAGQGLQAGQGCVVDVVKQRLGGLPLSVKHGKESKEQLK